MIGIDVRAVLPMTAEKLPARAFEPVRTFTKERMQPLGKRKVLSGTKGHGIHNGAFAFQTPALAVHQSNPPSLADDCKCNALQNERITPMQKLGSTRNLALFCSSMLLVVCLSAMPAFSQADELPNLKPNQTLGFGDNQLLRFTYQQSFDCVDQPHDDLNFNGVLAQSDPGEFQIPICQVGINPTIDPTGLHGASDPTEPLYVLVPMFSVDNDQNPDDAISCKNVVPGTNCGPALGKTLIKLFGAIPEAFKAKPLVYTQCPDPNLPPGTCTMHASRLDLGPVLVKLGYLPPPATNVFVPSPNHSHIVLNQDINIQAIWWQVIPVLVLDRSDWPDAGADNGITSFAKIKEAEKDGKAIQAPSNFYLFFSSYQADHHHSH